MEKVIQLNAYNLETVLWMNNGDGTFQRRKLPAEAQFSPVYAMFIDDMDGDSDLDILMGGNLSRAKPETGIYSGSYGLLLKGDGTGNFHAVKPALSGINIKGEIRGIQKISRNPGTVVVARNNDKLLFISYGNYD
jgi:hypothetical protein